MHHFNQAKNILFTFLLAFSLTATSYDEDEVDLYKRVKLSLTGGVAKSFVHMNRPLVTEVGKSVAGGGGLSFEVPFSRHFALGLEGNAFFEIEEKAPIYYDADIFAKAQFAFDETGSVRGNSFLKVPAGVSIMQWPEKLAKPSIGFNTGAFFGYQFYFARHFGLFTEVGYRYRYLPTSPKITFHFHVVEANLGLTVIF